MPRAAAFRTHIPETALAGNCAAGAGEIWQLGPRYAAYDLIVGPAYAAKLIVRCSAPAYALAVSAGCQVAASYQNEMGEAATLRCGAEMLACLSRLSRW